MPDGLRAFQKLPRTLRIGTSPGKPTRTSGCGRNASDPSNHYFLVCGSGPDLNKLLRPLAFISFRNEEIAS
jgi:hypothetical protein